MKRKQGIDLYRKYIITSSIGLEIVLSISLGIFVGMWFDTKYQSGPWGLLGGTSLAVLSITKRLIAVTRDYLNSNKNR